MTTDQIIDHAVHLAEILPVVGVVWALYRKVGRFIDVMIDFPPHRHVNGKIAYPVDMEPGRIERRTEGD